MQIGFRLPLADGESKSRNCLDKSNPSHGSVSYLGTYHDQNMNSSSNMSDCPMDESLMALTLLPVFRNLTDAWNRPSFVTPRRAMSVFLITFTLFGIIGNILCLLTMVRMEIQRFSTKFFFCIISISDMLCFPFNMLYTWVIFTYNIYPENHSEFVCKAFRFSLIVISLTSWIVLMIVSVERSLLVIAPQRMRSTTSSQKKFAPLIVLAIVICLIIYASSHLEYQIIHCTCIYYGSKLRYMIVFWIAVLTYAIITLQVGLSSLILIHILWKRSKRRVAAVDQPTPNNTTLVSLTPFKIIAGWGILQFVCIIPFVILHSEGRTGKFSDMDGGVIGFVYWCSYFLFLMSHGTNFYVSFAMSRKFRKTSLEMLQSSFNRLKASILPGNDNPQRQD